MKKVLILSNIAWTIANFRKYLIEDLINNGFEVYCVADIDEFSTESIKKIESFGAHFILIKTNRKGINPFLEMLYMLRLFWVFNRVSPDVTLSYTVKPNIFGSFAAKLLNIPQIATINGLGSGLLGNSLIAKISVFLYRQALKHPLKVFFQNTDDLNYFVKNKIVKRDKVVHVPGSGINVNDFNECARHASDEKTVFLLVARLIADKGVYEYIQAAKLIKEKGLHNCEFLLAGHFDEGNPTAIKATEVEQWVNEGIVRYLGKTDTIKDFFVQTDVIVLPSYREGLSRLLLEAASCLKPLIATNVPGCRELVQDNINGFICEPRDANSLAQAMEKMLLLSELDRDNFGIQSRKIVVENFAHDRVNAIYLNAIREMIE